MAATRGHWLTPSMASSSSSSSSSTEEIYLPGCGFAPDKSEIVHFLRIKEYSRYHGGDQSLRFIKEINLYKHDPLELSDLAIDSGHKKNYFFTRLEKKYENNEEIINRQTPSRGSWRITGSSITIEDKDGKPVARKTPFCYYQTSTKRTQWLMKEYMLLENEIPNQNELPSWALCVVYCK